MLLGGGLRSHFSPSAICFSVHKVEMIIITFIALFILDDGLHEHEDFYRLHSICAGNITFEPLLSLLPVLACEAQTPAPTVHPQDKSRFRYETLKCGCAGVLQGPLWFSFQLFPPELLGAKFVSWLLSSGALISSKP